LVERAAAILDRETRPDRGAPAVGESRISQLIAQYAGEDGARNLSEAAALVVAWRRAAAPSAAGTSAVIPLRVENGEDRPVCISFCASDLLSDNGRSIPSFAVSFEPKEMNVGPGQQGVLTVKVDVPQQSIPGGYSGLVQAAGMPGVKAVITVEVI
jgi:hypothetical protein